jgi:hypothetical protein
VQASCLVFKYCPFCPFLDVIIELRGKRKDDLMTETMFDGMAERLKTNICNEIAYTYTAFVPKDTKRVILEMKKNIILSQSGGRFSRLKFLKEVEKDKPKTRGRFLRHVTYFLKKHKNYYDKTSQVHLHKYLRGFP